ncbi:MAG: ABC transporter ATP-binding protein [Alphaproteobacteria bacterium]|nr:ABC transporter ATP-binding protein [Alphaproteobacteria bacterium]
MTPLIEVRDLHIRFSVGDGTVEAVKGASLTLWPARTLALVGESGSGKTVISQAIMRILPQAAEITSGRILFHDPQNRDGTPVDIISLEDNGRAMRAIRGGRISVIFQEPMTSLSPLHTVGDQVSEALHLHRRCSRAEGRELTIDMLRLAGFPDARAAFDSYPFELSGGLRQRAMIAMALVCRPALLIADEPTTALDVTIQAQILKLVNDLKSELSMAVLMITHDLGVVANVAEDIVVMYHGRIRERGSLEDIFHRARHPYLKVLLAAVPRFGLRPGERLVPLREIPMANIASMGRTKARGGTGETLLSVEGLTKTFTTRKSGLLSRARAPHVAVNDVSFEVRRGECLGLVGESGCGKTTTSKLILKALEPDAGTITFVDDGKPRDVVALKDTDLFAYRRKVQFIFQDPFGSLNPRMTVFDIIVEPLLIHGVGSARERAERVKDLINVVGLDVRHLRRYPHSFSGGQRQRIGIARALALEPELLICDEPVSALDVSIQAQVLNLLKDLQRKMGLTYIFISHNLAVVDYMADRIAVMCAGRLVEQARREELFSNPVHPYTRALLAAVPEPDPQRQLDLSLLMEGRASVPSEWPEPFTETGGLATVRVGDNHWVRATAVPGDVPS